MRPSKVEVQCASCGKPLMRVPYYVKKNKLHFCSVTCRRKGIQVQCAQCGETFYRIPSKLKRAKRHFCSSECRDIWQKGHMRDKDSLTAVGSANPRWKGGRIKRPDSYIDIKVYPDNFFYRMADHHGYVLEHRLVMAKHLHRCLLPWESVHHKNGIRDDNRLENLELLPSSSKHYSITRLSREIKKLTTRVDNLEKENRLLRWQVKELRKTEVIK